MAKHSNTRRKVHRPSGSIFLLGGVSTSSTRVSNPPSLLHSSRAAFRASFSGPVLRNGSTYIDAKNGARERSLLYWKEKQSIDATFPEKDARRAITGHTFAERL